MGKNVLVLGAHGMLGHVVMEIFEQNGHAVSGIALEGDARRVFAIDVGSFALDRFLQINPFDVVINCVGVLNRNAERDPGRAIALNALLPHRLERFYAGTDTKIIQPGTDCVFAGNTGPYDERSRPDGETYYDRTKALGELAPGRGLTLRTSIVGPDINEDGIGLLHWFMRRKGDIHGYKNAIWTGVTTMELARGMLDAVAQDIRGLYHYVPGRSISKYEMLCLFAEVMGKKDVTVIPVDEPRIDKSLLNTRTDFDREIPGYREMFEDMREWIAARKASYPHYMV
jgi:dTDP-4-dehydrorhamnose reductase